MELNRHHPPVADLHLFCLAKVIGFDLPLIHMMKKAAIQKKQKEKHYKAYSSCKERRTCHLSGWIEVFHSEATLNINQRTHTSCNLFPSTAMTLLSLLFQVPVDNWNKILMEWAPALFHDICCCRSIPSRDSHLLKTNWKKTRSKWGTTSIVLQWWCVVNKTLRAKFCHKIQIASPFSKETISVLNSNSKGNACI